MKGTTIGLENLQLYSERMEIKIREYTTADYDRLLIMETDLIDEMSIIDPHKRFRSRKDFNPRKYFDALLQELFEHQGKIIVAEMDGNIVGYLMGKIVHRREVDNENKYPAIQGYIEGLFVDAAHRGKGVSSQLITEIEKYFREQKCDYSSVACVSVNEAARNLYTKAGYGEQYIDYIKKL